MCVFQVSVAYPRNAGNATFHLPSLEGMNEKVLLGLSGSVHKSSKVPGSEASLVFQEAEGNRRWIRRRPVSGEKYREKARETRIQNWKETGRGRVSWGPPHSSRCDVYSKHVDSMCHVTRGAEQWSTGNLSQEQHLTITNSCTPARFQQDGECKPEEHFLGTEGFQAPAPQLLGTLWQVGPQCPSCQLPFLRGWMLQGPRRCGGACFVLEGMCAEPAALLRPGD